VESSKTMTNYTSRSVSVITVRKEKGEAQKRNPCRRNTDSAISIHVCTRGPLHSTASRYLLKSNVTAICYKRADNSRPVSFTVSAWDWVYTTKLISSAGRKSKRHVGEEHSVLITAILLPQRLSCYWGKIVSLRILTNLRLADMRLTTAQHRSTGQQRFYYLNVWVTTEENNVTAHAH
jgi:hypothetical protein